MTRDEMRQAVERYVQTYAGSALEPILRDWLQKEAEIERLRGLIREWWDQEQAGDMMWADLEARIREELRR